MGRSFEGGRDVGLSHRVGVGAAARLPGVAEGQDGDVVFERSAERPTGLWAEAGENLLRIVPLLGPDTPPADEPEDCQLCPGCYRPVSESSTSHTLIGAAPIPVFGLCRLCAEGTTPRSLRQADVPIDPQQRAVLETAAAALVQPCPGQAPLAKGLPGVARGSAAYGPWVAPTAPVRVVDADLVPRLASLEPGFRHPEDERYNPEEERDTLAGHAPGRRIAPHEPGPCLRPAAAPSVSAPVGGAAIGTETPEKGAAFGP